LHGDIERRIVFIRRYRCTARANSVEDKS